MSQKYIICEESTTNELQNTVNKRIAEWYECHWSIFQGKDIEWDFLYIQSMIKNK